MIPFDTWVTIEVVFAGELTRTWTNGVEVKA
jgi:hypothetical protein